MPEPTSRNRLADAATAFTSNARDPDLRRAQLSFLGAWPRSGPSPSPSASSPTGTAARPRWDWSGCSAWSTTNLSLEFVAHVGDIATQTIRQRPELVGIEVILVHRLPKNPVRVREYVLLSEDLYRTGSSAIAVRRTRSPGRCRGDRPSPCLLRRPH
jgi:hypothetical protein